MNRIELPVRAVLVDSRTLHRGSLAIESERIVARVGVPSQAPPWFAIPGLRNAHVHLDLSGVGFVRRAQRGFAAWVLDLLRARGPFDPRTLQRAATLGARLALESGTTSVADIDSSGSSAAAVACSGLKGISFREILGATPAEVVESGLDRWIRSFSEFAPSGEPRRVRPGVSPHAPYSTPPALYALARACSERGIPYTTHIAETHAEADYLRTLGGEFAALFETLEVAGPRATPVAISPLAYLEELGGLAPDHLLAHVNHPEPGDLERLERSRAIVAFCPRSHAFFGHRRHPVLEYLDRGIPVALGTDSLASNGSLSMFDEMAFLSASRPELGARRIFEMATCAAAKLLDSGSGRLAEGEVADLVIVEARGGVPETVDEALQCVTSGAVRVIETHIGGAKVVPPAVVQSDPVP